MEMSDNLLKEQILLDGVIVGLTAIRQGIMIFQVQIIGDKILFLG